jgi:hypothetical protein
MYRRANPSPGSSRECLVYPVEHLIWHSRLPSIAEVEKWNQTLNSHSL